jgi:hypothetical protein
MSLRVFTNLLTTSSSAIMTRAKTLEDTKHTHYPQTGLKTSTSDHEEHQSLHTGAIVY